MHVDVRLTPASQCAVGNEVLYPLIGQRMLWRIFDAHPDGLAARSADTNDILVLPPQFPVPVIVAKHQHQFNRAYNSATNTTQTFGGGFGGNYQGTSNA